MNVKELIESLEKLDPTLPVVFTDYSDGTIAVDQVIVHEILSWTDNITYQTAEISGTKGF